MNARTIYLTALPVISFWLVLGFGNPLHGYAPDAQSSATESCDVVSLHEIRKFIFPIRGAFPRWSEAAGLITFTREVCKQFEVFTMKPDGSGVRCLTCNKRALADTRHRGQSAWHPNGKYIVFTAENAQYPRKGKGTTARPGIGRNFNVWIMRSDGSAFWQMTDYEDNWGVIEPFFSHDGTMLHWDEEFMMEKYPHGKPGVDDHPGCYWGYENLTYRKGEELCAWRVKYAKISFDAGTGTPAMSDVKAIDPPDNFTLIESNGFTPDDTGFIGTYADLSQTGGSGLTGDIYTWGLNGESLRQLTHTPEEPDEDPCYSPDGKTIAWKHLSKYPAGDDEVYLMDANGDNQVKLTHFNDSGSSGYDPFAQQNTEHTWNPDGTSLMIGHVSSLRSMGPHIPSKLYALTFEGSCGSGQ